MDHVVPQDEYFEWEDIMAYHGSSEDTNENGMLQSESIASCCRKTEGVGACELPDTHHNEGERAGMAPSKSLYSIRTSLALDSSFWETKSSPINFPSYAEFGSRGSAFLIENFATESKNYEISRETMDDIALSPAPLRHVDYLSHDWLEEDIWATWKRLVSRRKAQNVARRLENASWRAWTKVRLNLKTVAPETFNWYACGCSALGICILTVTRMKDLDDTWLYGPFHGNSPSTTALVTHTANDTHAPCTTLTVTKTRSILKRPRLSEILLRGSDYIRTSRSKSVEVESMSFFGNAVKKRVGFREEADQYAAVQKAHADENDCQDGLDHWIETYQSKLEHGGIYDNPVEELISTTQSLRHHVEQNIKILGNYSQQKTMEKLAGAPLKYLKSTASSESSSGDRSKIANIPTRCYNEPLRFSTLSEWTLLGEDFDEEEDWIEQAPYTTLKPNAESDIASGIRTRPSQDNLFKEKVGDVQIDVDDQERELTALMTSEDLYLDPSSSDTSESHSSSSEDIESGDLAYVSICDFPEERSEVREIRTASTFHQMKQAFVDRVMEDFYISSKEDGAQDFNRLVPPDLIHPALKAA
jgi:hypothetical protein